MSSSKDDPEIPAHLQPGFDPNKLTISALTSILSASGVEVPGQKQKKEYYVQQFNEAVTPRREKLIADLTKSYGKPPRSGAFKDVFSAASEPSGSGEKEGKMTPRKRRAAEEKTKKKGGATVLVDNFDGSGDDGGDEELTTEVLVPTQRKKKSASKKASGSGVDEGASFFSDENPFQTPKKEDRTKTRVKRVRKVAADSGSDDKSDMGDKQAVSALRAKGRLAGAAAVPSPQPFMFKMKPDMHFVEDDDPPTFGEGSDAPATPSIKKVARRKPLPAKKALASTTSDESDDKGGQPATAVATPVKEAVPKKKPATSASPEKKSSEAVAVPSIAGPSTPSASPPRFLNFVAPPQTPTPAVNTPKPAAVDTPATKTSPARKAADATEGESWTTVSPRQKTTKPAAVRKVKVVHKVRRREPVVDWTLVVGLLLITLGGLLGHWYWERRDVIGYNDDPDVLAKSPYTGHNPLGYILPVTRECPPRAACVGRTVLSCDHPDYVLQPNALAKIIPPHYLPFPLAEPSCQEDRQKLRNEIKKQQQLENILDVLDGIARTWVGKVECGQIKTIPAVTGTKAVGDKTAPSWVWSRGQVTGIPISIAKTQLRNAIGRKWSDSKFEEYWDLVLQRFAQPKADDVLTTVLDDTHTHRFIRSSRPPIMSISCRMRRNLWETSKAYWLELLSTGAAIALAILLWHKRLASIRDSRIVAQCVEDALDAVHEETDRHFYNPVKHPIPGLSVTQLRDHLLPIVVPGRAAAASRKRCTSTANGVDYTTDDSDRTVWYLPDESARDRIWNRVQQLVLKNSNVRETTMELKGEMHMVWQWIGSVALSPRKKRGGGDRSGWSSASDPETDIDSGKDVSKRAPPAKEGKVEKAEKVEQAEQSEKAEKDGVYPGF
ncbi:inner nuclear membrane protein enriched at telomere/subtelomere region [Borealophlyctis nickersoniae]|nr:inner nuclear membrane protein enriched at telomere/subtelomere region [Borealophlyctis nickersoniae]